MKLLEDIIELATDNKESVSNLLRKCLVLEQQIKNEKFKTWLDKELDGYDKSEEMPSYRVFNCVNRGTFIGIAAQLNNQPLALHVMDERDRKMVEQVHLFQPIASYEARPDKENDAILPWNPHLTAKYQTKFLKDKDMVLNRAWQEIPGSVLVGLIETVRTRVLRFALELKNVIPEEAKSATNVSAAVVERNVVNNIFNGNVLIANSIEYTNQIVKQDVTVGDFSSLRHALEQIGVTDEGIKQLKSDIEADKNSGTSGLGERAKGWLTDMGKYVGKEGLKIGVEVAKKAAMKWLMQHYGLSV